MQGEISDLIHAQIKLYVMIAELEQNEKENEIVNTEINNAKIISEDVSMSTERQELYLMQIWNNFLTRNQIGN